jgi:F0F1-type ATP synthase membrane subunit b/b'
VAQDPAATDSRAKPAAGDAAERLKAIRGRVAELQRRIKTERDPKAVAELRAEVGKLTDLIAELVQASGGKRSDAKKADAVVWPRDLSAEPAGTPAWGADPSEVTGG